MVWTCSLEAQIASLNLDLPFSHHFCPNCVHTGVPTAEAQWPSSLLPVFLSDFLQKPDGRRTRFKRFNSGLFVERSFTQTEMAKAQVLDFSVGPLVLFGPDNKA